MCRPVSIIRQAAAECETLTTLLNKYARPVAPVNRVDDFSVFIFRTIKLWAKKSNQGPTLSH